MKKVLLIIGIAIAVLFATNIESKAQSALNLQGGYSWSEGNFGAGYQYGTIEFKAGYQFTKMPGDKSSVSGPVFTFIWGPEWDESGYYISYTWNSVGYRSQVDYGSGWTDDVVAGMNIISIGYKVGSYNFYLKADFGYGWSPEGTGASYGIVLGVPLFGN